MLVKWLGLTKHLQMDTFSIEAADIGRIKKLKIWHDNAYAGAAWFLDKVEVEDQDSKQVYAFFYKYRRILSLNFSSHLLE